MVLEHGHLNVKPSQTAGKLALSPSSRAAGSMTPGRIRSGAALTEEGHAITPVGEHFEIPHLDLDDKTRLEEMNQGREDEAKTTITNSTLEAANTDPKKVPETILSALAKTTKGNLKKLDKMSEEAKESVIFFNKGEDDDA